MRDKLHISNLSRTLFPENPKFLMESYKEAVEKKPFNYLMVNVKPEASDNMRVCTGIFNSEVTYCFRPT